MPPKSNKSTDKSKGSKKGDGANLQLIPAITIKMERVETAIYSLNSPEKFFIFKSLSSIDEFVSLNEQLHLKFIAKFDSLWRFINILKNPEIVVESHKMACKLINRFFKYDKYLETARDRIPELEFVINIFLTTQDNLLLTAIIDLIYRLCTFDEFVQSFCRQTTVDKLFNLFLETQVLYRANKCIELLHIIVSCENKQENLCYFREYQIGILTCLLRRPYFQDHALNMIHQFSKLDLTCLHQAMAKCCTLERLLRLLMSQEWETLQNQVMSIILNCLTIYSYPTKMLGSKDFLQFFNYALYQSSDHGYACITLIGEFSKTETGRQALFDLKIIQELPKFFQFRSTYLNIKICDVLVDLCTNCFIPATTISTLYLKELAKMMNYKIMSWNPYRQAPILPLHIFLKARPKLGALYKQYPKIFNNLKEAIIDQDQLDEKYFEYVIDMYHILLSTSTDHHKLLLSVEVYKIFLNKFKEYIESNTADSSREIYMKLILLSLQVVNYRKMFVEFKAQEFMHEYLKLFGNDINWNLLQFFKNVLNYKNISRALLRTKIITTLKKMSLGIPNSQKMLCKTMIHDLYNCDLTIKFFETRELEMTDEVKTEFTTYLGPAPFYFPYKSPPQLEFISEINTMVVVNVEEKVENTRGIDTDLNYCTCQYTNDCMIQSYIKELRAYFKKERIRKVTPRKIEVIGRYVCSVMCANANNFIFRLIQHRNELKEQLKSNYIPLGLMKIGGIVERALLFKVLADHLGIPCTFTRSKIYDGIAWNEVYLDSVHYNEVMSMQLDSDSESTVSIEEEHSLSPSEIEKIIDDSINSSINKGSFSNCADKYEFYSTGKLIGTSLRLPNFVKITNTNEVHINNHDAQKLSIDKKSPPAVKKSVAPSTTVTDNDSETADPSCDMDDDLYFDEKKCYLDRFIVDLKENYGALLSKNSKLGYLYRNHVSNEDAIQTNFQFEKAQEMMLDLR